MECAQPSGLIAGDMPAEGVRLRGFVFAHPVLTALAADAIRRRQAAWLRPGGYLCNYLHNAEAEVRRQGPPSIFWAADLHEGSRLAIYDCEDALNDPGNWIEFDFQASGAVDIASWPDPLDTMTLLAMDLSEIDDKGEIWGMSSGHSLKFAQDALLACHEELLRLLANGDVILSGLDSELSDRCIDVPKRVFADSNEIQLDLHADKVRLPSGATLWYARLRPAEKSKPKVESPPSDVRLRAVGAGLAQDEAVKAKPAKRGKDGRPNHPAYAEIVKFGLRLLRERGHPTPDQKKWASWKDVRRTLDEYAQEVCAAGVVPSARTIRRCLDEVKKLYLGKGKTE